MFAALLAFAAAQATIPPQEPVAPPPTQASEKKKPQLYCRSMEISGTRMRARICHDQYGNLMPTPGVSGTLSTKVRGYKDPDEVGTFSPN
jgi:hypothetical protein